MTFFLFFRNKKRSFLSFLEVRKSISSSFFFHVSVKMVSREKKIFRHGEKKIFFLLPRLFAGWISVLVSRLSFFSLPLLFFCFVCFGLSFFLTFLFC